MINVIRWAARDTTKKVNGYVETVIGLKNQMKKMNKVAFIIPIYDNLEGLKKLVKQVRGCEIYIIEDGQNKETIRWLKKQKVHKIFHKQNEGVAKSWNDGIKQALKDNCTHFVISNDDIELCAGWQEKVMEELKSVDLVFLDQPSPITFTGWFFAFTRVALYKTGYFDEQFEHFSSEDADWWYRYLQTGLKYSKIDIPIIHKGGVTTNKILKENPQFFRKVWNENWTKLRKKHPKLKMQNQLK